MKKSIFLGLVFLFFSALSFAQDMELEKTYEITGNADIGEIANISMDQASGGYTVSFIVKSKSNALSVENYSFDNEFNFIKNENDVLPFEEAAKEYPWWNYKGQEFEIQNITLDESEDIIFIKKTISYEYNWKKLNYNTKVRGTDKFPFKTEKGLNYFHHRNWIPTDESNTSYILCGETSKSDKFLQYKNYHLLQIDNSNFNIIKDLEIKFSNPQSIACPRFIDDKSEGRGNEFNNRIVLVFAPMNEKGITADPNSANYTFFNIDESCNIIDRISFTPQGSFWSIEEFILDDQKNAVYLIGASVQTKSKYFNEYDDHTEFDAFQVMKIADHEIKYLNSVPLSEFNKKAILAPSQESAKAYDGKRFLIADYSINSFGDLLIAGQSWYVDVLGTMNNIQNGAIGAKSLKIKYSDCFLLAFDDKGELTKQYLFDSKGFMGGNDMSIYQYMFFGENPKNIYWFLIQPFYWNWDFTTSVYSYRPVKQPPLKNIKLGLIRFNCDIIASHITKIESDKNLISDFKNHQAKSGKGDEKTYYLCPTNPIIQTPDNKLVLFGSQSMTKGKVLWFARVRLD